MIYPIEVTCFEDLKWLSNDKIFNISPKFQSLDNQAWSKGWSNYDGDLSREEYIKNFFWVKVWASVHGLLILKKLSIFIAILIILFFLFHNIKHKKIEIKKKINKEILFLSLLAALGVLIWFLRFPLFRYGSSYVILLIVILTTIFFAKFNFEYKDEIKIKKIYTNLSLIIYIFICIKTFREDL